MFYYDNHKSYIRKRKEMTVINEAINRITMAPCLNNIYGQLYCLSTKKSNFIKRNLKQKVNNGRIDQNKMKLMESQPEESET